MNSVHLRRLPNYLTLTSDMRPTRCFLQSRSPTAQSEMERALCSSNAPTAIPLAFFPDSMRSVLYVLPFAAMVAIPIDVFLGKLDGTELVSALGLQAIWALVWLGIGRLVLAAGLRKLVVQGG